MARTVVTQSSIQILEKELKFYLSDEYICQLLSIHNIFSNKINCLIFAMNGYVARDYKIQLYALKNKICCLKKLFKPIRPNIWISAKSGWSELAQNFAAPIIFYFLLIILKFR